MGDFAKLLCQNGVAIGQKRLFAWLRQNGYLTSDNKPTQRATEQGLFRMTETLVVTSDGGFIRTTTKITGKGQTYFAAKFGVMQ